MELDRLRLRPRRPGEANEDERQHKQHVPQPEKPRFHRQPPRMSLSLWAASLIPRRRIRNGKVSGAAMARWPPSSSRMAVAVGCMYGDADLRVDGIVPWPPRDHAARIRISGLPALLDRGLREIDVPRITLAVE